MNRMVRGLGAALILLVVIAGAPSLLLRAGRLEFAARLSWPATLLRPDDGSLLLLVLTLLGWLAWLVVAVCVAVEAARVVSCGRIRVRLPGLGWVQPAVGTLVALSLGVALAPGAHATPPVMSSSAETSSRDMAKAWSGSVVMPLPDAASSASSIPASQDSMLREQTASVPSPSEQAVPDALVTHVVAAGEDLWSLAERYYGDGTRWRDIVSANDTVVLDPLADLAAGAVLAIPAGSVPASPPTRTRGNEVIVAPGDSLWAIAEESYGDGTRWVDIYRANRNQIADPDLIRPGWVLTLPGPDSNPDSETVAVTSQLPSERRPAGSRPAGSLEETKGHEISEFSDAVSPAPSPMVDAVGASPQPTILPVDPPAVESESLANDATLGTANLATVPSEADFARLAAGLAPVVAAGLVGLVVARRKIQLNRRRLGRRIPTPSLEAQRLEQTLASVVDEASLPNAVMSHDMPPGVTAIGLDEIDEPVWYDVEAAGVTRVGCGSAQLATEFVAGLVTSVLASPWTSRTQVTLAPGKFDWVASLDDPRVKVVDDASEAFDQLASLARRRLTRLNGESLATVRSIPDLADAWDTHVFIICDPRGVDIPDGVPTASELASLGIGVVVVGELAASDADIRITATRGRLADGRDFAPLLMTAPARRALIELFVTTGSETTTEAPWWDSGWHPPDLRLVGAEPHLTRKEDIMALDPMGAPQLMLLGSIELTGARGVPPSRSIKQCIEYCAWIHTHPGCTATMMTSGLLVAEGTRRSNMSRLRTWLGDDDAGEAYLPDAYSGRIALHPGVTSDWERLGLLVHGGVNQASTQTLRMALELVRGAPLADAAPGQWHWAEELRCDMISTIRDIGAVVARRALDDGDIDLARWAAARALTASPEDETLMGLRILTEHRAGNHDEVERLVLHLTRSARAIGVDLADETVTLLQEVMEGRARARMA